MANILIKKSYEFDIYVARMHSPDIKIKNLFPLYAYCIIFYVGNISTKGNLTCANYNSSMSIREAVKKKLTFLADMSAKEEGGKTLVCL